MKWWGWGAEDIVFDISNRPQLWPYIQSQLQLTEDPLRSPAVAFDQIVLPAASSNISFARSIASALGSAAVFDTKRERLLHAFGKSFRDLWRVRQGIVPYAPDYVIYPASHAQVCALLEAAHRFDICLIPFGGGSNIAGCLEAAAGKRVVASVDMRRMNRVLHIDETSHTATVEAGIMGPELESQLRARGFTLGHFPDSFEFSSAGGWVATRSAGMQSDRYGKIEDMVLALKMVTPQGVVESRIVPKSSNGIDINHLCIGSEGTLGIITEITFKIHRSPACKESFGYLFPDFSSGIAAMHQTRREGLSPVFSRLNDPNKTALSFAYKKSQSRFKTVLSSAVKKYLKHVKRMNFSQTALMLVAIEGSQKVVHCDRRRLHRIYQRFGAVALGSEPGRAFEAGKYDFPYLRDFLWDRGVRADVTETSTVWSNLLPLYQAVTQSLNTAIGTEGTPGWVGCHVSHTYDSGASLYFTFGYVAKANDDLRHYLRIKKASEDAFSSNGGTLSHHHAVGYEHLPWLEAEITPAGLIAVEALKKGLDPKGLMNPGKLASGYSFADWGLPPDVALAAEYMHAAPSGEPVG